MGNKGSKEDDEVEEEETQCEDCGEECTCGGGAEDTFKGMKKGLKAPTVSLGGLGGSAAPTPCVCRDLFVIPLPDPTQVKDLLAKGRVGGDEGETKGEDKV